MSESQTPGSHDDQGAEQVCEILDLKARVVVLEKDNAEMRAQLKRGATSALDLSEARVTQLKQRDIRIAHLKEEVATVREAFNREVAHRVEIGVRISQLLTTVKRFNPKVGGDDR